MRVAVVGGGPAGVISAIELAKNGNEVFILEKNSRILKKLLATGNGRCNYTNVSVTADNYNCKNNFVEECLKLFTKDDLIDYFKMMGVEPVVENRGKIFPVTLKSNTVVNTLLNELEDNNVNVITDEEVINIKKKGRFLLTTKNSKYESDIVIFAAGGSSMPSSGSDGKSYKVLENLGHTKIDTFPALTQLTLKSDYLKSLSGVKVVGTVKLLDGKKVIEKRNGDLLFTNYGISGPPILDISRKVNEKNRNLKIEMPLINNIEDTEKFREILYSRYYTLSYFSLERWLMGIIDKKFVPMVLREINIPRETPMNMIEEYKFEILLNILLKSTFEVTGTKGFENSQVTCGGISTEEINKKTMESKIVKGLYIVGEVMDVDGDCGGYNLQWAFSSGINAARSIICKTN